MPADDSKFYLGYLNKLADKYNNSYHHSIGKKPIDADYSVLTEEIETYSKARKFKVSDRARFIKYKNISSKCYTNIWWTEIFVIGSVLKPNPWIFKTKYLNGEKIIISFYEKELLLSKLKVSYY